MISQTEVKDSEGKIATVYGVSADESSLIVKMEDNRMVSVPLNLLQIEDSKRYFLTQSFRELRSHIPENQSLPVIEEVPIIEKRTIETGKVNIRKSVTETPKVVEETLAKEEYDVQRIPLNDLRDEPAQMRVEGDLTIIPVQEEILVVQKKFLVREEIRIRKITTQHDEKVTVSVRKEEVTVDRKKIN